MNPPLVVSFSGYQGSGKDTFADYLVQRYGCTKLAFADSMKDMCSKYYNVPRNYFDVRELKEAVCQEHGISPREMCINLGAHMRSINPMIFIDEVLKKIEPEKCYVISDCRKFLELRTLKERFGADFVSIYVKRFTDAPSNHPIEHEIKPWHCDYVLDNTDSPVNFTKLEDICAFKKIEKEVVIN